jgi:hypothetical protein
MTRYSNLVGDRRPCVHIGAGHGARLAHLLQHIGQQGGCRQNRFVTNAPNRRPAYILRQDNVSDAVLVLSLKVGVSLPTF